MINLKGKRQENKEEINPKKKALIKLGLWILFIVIVCITVSGNDEEEALNKGLEESVKEKREEKELNMVEVFFQNNPNYQYEYDILLDDKNYLYLGNYQDGVLTIEKNNEQYLYKNEKYYQVLDNKEEEINEEAVYDIIPLKYLDYHYLLTYLNKSVVDYKKEYRDNSLEIGYIVYLKDIMDDYTEDETITLVVSNQDNLIIDIDYTNLFLVSQEIKNAHVKLTYKTFKEL